MRAVCYCRTSTLDQAREEKVSIPDQINWAKTFALERGWEWIKEYIEPGVTGDTEPENREALSQLLNDANSGNFDIVLVYHSSRLAREPDIGMKVCRLLGQKRIQTYFRNAPIDPVHTDQFAWGTNIGSQYMTAFSFIGDFQENVARSERVRSGFVGLAKRGKLFNAPYGYKKISQIKTDPYGKQIYDWHFETVASEVLIVKRIFETYVSANGSLRQIMLSLNKENVPSPSGKIGLEAWSATSIRNILTNSAYIGKVHWGKKLGGKYLQGKTNSGKQRRVFTPSETWITTDSVNHKKFLDEELFNKAQEKLQLRYTLKGRAVASDGLLTGLVKCGRCGKGSYYKTTKRKNLIRHDYTCSSYFTYKSCKRHVMSANKLHDIIIAEISKVASNPNYRKTLLKQQGDSHNGSIKQQLEILTTGLRDIETKQHRILLAYETDTLSLEEFGKEKGRLDEEAITMSKEISKLEKILTDTSQAVEAKKRFMKILSNFKVGFKKGDFARQKDLLRSLISSIVVKGNNIKINYRL